MWDAVVGVRGKLNIKDGWYLPCHLDIGTGQSDLTWQALGGVGYQFRWGQVLLAYRHIEWNFDDVALLDDLTFSGPGLGVTYDF